MFESVYNALKENGIEYIVTVPSKEVKDLLFELSFKKEIKMIFPQREDEALAIILGLELANKKTLGIFQDSFLGNSQIMLGVILQSSDIPLRIWLGSRKGKFLKENPLHGYITERSSFFLQHDTLWINSIEIEQEIKDIQGESLKLIKKSLETKRNERKFLFWEVI